MIAAAKV